MSRLIHVEPGTIAVELGNVAPLDHIDPDYVAPEWCVEGEVPTSVRAPEGADATEVFLNITDERDGLWKAHSSAAPSFVAASDPKLQARLAAYFDCPTRVVEGINS